jgi:lauroyl/myristoyl acyltransferase
VRVLIWLSDGYRRILAIFVALAGPRNAYRFAERLARILYRSLPFVQSRTEAQCRAALDGVVPPADIPRLAEQSFVHRQWNLTDLMLADRLLHPNTYARYGGQIPQPYLDMLLEAQGRRQPVILLTAYYGAYDLLPVFAGYNGIALATVYRPHRNPRFDAYRNRIRARAGCELIPIQRALERVPQVLETGGTVALLADHHTEGHGVPSTFLGLPTNTSRLVGLLADRFGAVVAVAGIRRTGRPFHFEIEVAGLLTPQEWRSAEDPVVYITHWYLQAIERIVRAEPAQYLWSYARWGEETAGQLSGTSLPQWRTQ